MLNSKENGKRILKMSKYNGVAEAVSCRIEALNEMLNVILGDELIITYETEKRPLRRNKVEIIINKYLL